MAKTIAEFVIRRWIDTNFFPGSVKVLIEGNTAKITDKNGDTAVIIYNKETNEVYMLDD